MYFNARVFFEEFLSGRNKIPTLFTHEDLITCLELWILDWHGKKKSKMEEFGLVCRSNWCSNEEPTVISKEEIEEWKVIFNEA